jgi:hypothetical protein
MCQITYRPNRETSFATSKKKRNTCNQYGPWTSNRGQNRANEGRTGKEEYEHSLYYINEKSRIRNSNISYEFWFGSGNSTSVVLTENKQTKTKKQKNKKINLLFVLTGVLKLGGKTNSIEETLL